jgi:hypothetical protein
MKNIFFLIIILFSNFVFAQINDPDINIDVDPAILQLGQTGTLKVSICNNGSSPTASISPTRLIATISIGTNAKITGINSSTSTAGWEQLGTLDNATNNTIQIGNVTTSIPTGTCHDINLNIQATAITIPASSVITSNIAYAFGNQGDNSQNNNSTTSLEVIASVMPIDLISFEAIEKDCKTSLEWSTANEINFSHFNVEQSFDAQSFKTVANIKGGANNGKYSLNDQSLRSHSYYRLKMIDLDGTFKYSNIGYVENKNCLQSISVYPNITSNIVNIKGGDESFQVKVTSINGELILNHKMKAAFDEINLNDLVPGLYHIQIYNGDVLTHSTKVNKI